MSFDKEFLKVPIPIMKYVRNQDMHFESAITVERAARQSQSNPFASANVPHHTRVCPVAIELRLSRYFTQGCTRV